MTLNVNTLLNISAVDEGAHDFGGPFLNVNVRDTAAFLNGTGVGQASKLFADQRTVASGANDDLDLSGVLLMADGTAFAITTLVGVLIVNAPIDDNAPPNTTNLTFAGTLANQVNFFGGGSGFVVRPGGKLYLECGASGGVATVVGGTNDLLRITNAAGASNTYQIILFGR